ncbi:hypothetical protein [Butyrivibrio sp. NC3005]|uniref:hypothetical protein n=1 Tax=Butyrivibrio sp. NC3005 TaxID=1280685 RepID=UPI00040C4B6D|nr:hypothetical protein [Butyrivibrio sp. NC3005]
MKRIRLLSTILAVATVGSSFLGGPIVSSYAMEDNLTQLERQVEGEPPSSDVTQLSSKDEFGSNESLQEVETNNTGQSDDSGQSKDQNSNRSLETENIPNEELQTKNAQETEIEGNPSIETINGVENVELLDDETDSSREQVQDKKESDKTSEDIRSSESVDFSKKLDGVKITIHVDKGILPQDTAVDVIKVDQETEKNIKKVISNNAGSETTIDNTYSYDILLRSKESKIENGMLNGNINVTFDNVNKKDSQKVDVYNVTTKNRDVEKIEKVPSSTSKRSVSFTTKQCSTFTITVLSNKERMEPSTLDQIRLDKDLFSYETEDGTSIKDLISEKDIFAAVVYDKDYLPTDIAPAIKDYQCVSAKIGNEKIYKIKISKHNNKNEISAENRQESDSNEKVNSNFSIFYTTSENGEFKEIDDLSSLKFIYKSLKKDELDMNMDKIAGAYIRMPAKVNGQWIYEVPEVTVTRDEGPYQSIQNPTVAYLTFSRNGSSRVANCITKNYQSYAKDDLTKYVKIDRTLEKSGIYHSTPKNQKVIINVEGNNITCIVNNEVFVSNFSTIKWYVVKASEKDSYGKPNEKWNIDGSLQWTHVGRQEDIEITITPEDLTYVYDGKIHNGFMVKSMNGLFTNDKVSVTADKSDEYMKKFKIAVRLESRDVKDVGETPITVKYCVYIDLDDGLHHMLATNIPGNKGTLDDSTMYNVTVKVNTAKLAVTPAPIKIKTDSAEKYYDGKPLTEKGYKVEGIVNNETYGFETTGSQTEVGKSDNTYEMTWKSDDNNFTAKKENYELIEEKLGLLEVKKKDETIPNTPSKDTPTPNTPPHNDNPRPNDPSVHNDSTPQPTTVTPDKQKTVQKVELINGINDEDQGEISGKRRNKENEGSVLGQKRTKKQEGDVLGASRKKAKEGEVLGKRRPRSTGDNSNLALNICILMLAAVSISVIVLRKVKKN